MNKTININLGGIFFHIDEVAYQKLKNYLNAIRRSLSDDPKGKDEIINDIELRIGEILSEKVKDVRQVINENDIDEVVEVMGKPEDYMVDEDVFSEETYSYTRKKTSKKLYRDGDDKFLGGVASGTAHYLGIEPIWSRIIWLILAFGVGFGFLVYPLLWILLPEAKTTSEKLEMEGESVNIDNIERKIRKEFSEASERVKEGASHVSEQIKGAANDISDNLKKKDYNKYSNKAKSGLQDFLDTLGSILLVLLKVFAKFIGALIIFISAITLLVLVIGAFSWGSLEFLGFGERFLQYPPEIFHSVLPYWLIVLFFFSAIAIPFVMLFMIGLKILSSNAKSFGKVTGLTLLAIWIIAILGLIFSGLDISSRYSETGLSNTTNDVLIVAKDTLTISMIGNDNFQDTKHFIRNSNLRSVNDNGIEKLYSENIDFDVRKSETGSAYLKIRKSAHGRDFNDANSNAEKLEYQYNLINTDLRLNGYFLNVASRKIGFFNHGVDVILYLPEGYHIYLDKSTKTFLDDVANTQDIYDRDMIDHYYVMGKSELECLDCNGNELIKNDNDSDSFNMNINEDGVKINISTDDNEKSEVIINEDGVKITSTKDSI